jgi:hypothetical protein
MKNRRRFYVQKRIFDLTTNEVRTVYTTIKPPPKEEVVWPADKVKERGLKEGETMEEKKAREMGLL